ncbi:uncharacterized protein BDR25DRAFT_348224 [Lindgomyces ingoldianus]|uniref:Uncharacterized protein n=1 Tax=Lindgomyces ingoldianus TaxID=673940 RepID=A0ACB6RHW2_9PLEO|nr:uncharacterized protein BDR25DRAFT_348224 [Lindgomyces ingoldianus]KAF2477920.1 hypothetical protein BDR25DRAFT_348224 [Lindgomyces ingoldianus]
MAEPQERVNLKVGGRGTAAEEPIYPVPSLGYSGHNTHACVVGCAPDQLNVLRSEKCYNRRWQHSDCLNIPTHRLILCRKKCPNGVIGPRRCSLPIKEHNDQIHSRMLPSFDLLNRFIQSTTLKVWYKEVRVPARLINRPQFKVAIYKPAKLCAMDDFCVKLARLRKANGLPASLNLNTHLKLHATIE